MKIIASKINLAELPVTEWCSWHSITVSPGGQGRWLVPSIQHWLYPIWPSSGPSSTQKTWTNWSESIEGPLGWIRHWSMCHMRRDCDVGRYISVTTVKTCLWGFFFCSCRVRLLFGICLPIACSELLYFCWSWPWDAFCHAWMINWEARVGELGL